MPTKLTNEIINAAIDGYQFQKSQIDAKITELRAMLPGGTTQTAATPEPAKRQRRKMSAASRKAIAEAQRKRWAPSKIQAEAATPKPAKPKRKLSKAGRAAIVAALKKRWAARKAETAKAKPAAAKKAAVKKVVRGKVNDH